MVSPPKPWERAGGAAVSTSSPMTSTPMPSIPTSTSTTTNPTSPSQQSIPTVPERPSSLPSTSTSTALASTTNPYNRVGTSPYGSTMGSYGSGYGGLGSYSGIGSSYGGYGGMSSYGSGYGGYGGYSSMGGLGSYGGLGMNGGYGGYGGYGAMGGLGMGAGMGMNGMGMMGAVGPDGMPLQPSLTQTLEATTQHTFQLLHAIVQTFSGVAQMLESTFMATHSSFFAMVGVVDQFGQLRSALGSVLGLFGLLRWLKGLLTGSTGGGQGGLGTGPGGAALEDEFKAFVNGRAVRPVGAPGAPGTLQQPKASKKPLIIFLLAVFGVPYAMSKLIKVLTQRAQEQQALAAANGSQLVPGQGPQGVPGQGPQGVPGQGPMDPASLTFARALYPFSASTPAELTLKENEIVAITGKIDPRTGMEVDPKADIGSGPGLVGGQPGQGESEWWKGRTREGREGWFPRKWVEVLERREAKKVD